MQLHPLLSGRIFACLVVYFHNILGAELHILAVAGQLYEPLHPQPHAGGNGALQGAKLLGLHVLADGNGVFVVRHVKGQHPHAGAAGLMAVGKKHLALHHNAAHLGVQPLHGNGSALDGLAQQHLLAALLLHSGEKTQTHLPKAVMLLQKLLQRRFGGVGQGLPHLHLRLQRAALPIQLSGHDLGVRQRRPQIMRRQKTSKKF